jgi:hypothetical protein
MYYTTIFYSSRKTNCRFIKYELLIDNKINDGSLLFYMDILDTETHITILLSEVMTKDFYEYFILKDN